MRRRNVVEGIASMAAWPSLAQAQQRAIPLIGFLSSRSPQESAGHTAALLNGLKAFSYVDGQTARIEYRWASGEYARLPTLARELAALHPEIVVSGGGAPAAHAMKAATSSIPIVFVSGDPVADGLVVSLANPGGNITGVSLQSGELGGKRLGLLVRLVSNADVAGLLTNPQNRGDATTQTKDVGAAAKMLGLKLVVVGASTESELDASFASLAKAGVKALVVQNDPSFDAQRDRIIALAAQRRIPAIFHIREYPAGGALMSYGASLVDAYRQVGVQAGRVLKGARIGDLPVMQPTRFELVINLRTARTLDLTVPPTVLAQADEVLE
jgi:putative tryptophan/tyrosine transport system substrate-binding protein